MATLEHGYQRCNCLNTLNILVMAAWTLYQQPLQEAFEELKECNMSSYMNWCVMQQGTAQWLNLHVVTSWACCE